MPVEAKDLWSLALDHLQVDPDDLVEAIEDQVRRGDLDYRSRLLIHDSLEVLQLRWGPERLQRWLLASRNSHGGHPIGLPGEVASVILRHGL